MAMDSTATEPFAVKDCALIAIATGRKVLTLMELLESLAGVSTSSIYHHFWGGLLEPRFEEREYNNDFASWARHALHDPVLAERLAVIDPTRFPDLEGLRQTLIDMIETRIEEDEPRGRQAAIRQFELIRSQIVVFDTGRRLSTPRELAEHVPQMSTGSIFYHFIDARRRLEHDNDFSAWLATIDSGFEDLCRRLDAIDPFFGSLTQLRDGIAAALQTAIGEQA
jgi:hypothetical protein